MSTFSNVTIGGFLGHNPVLRYTQNGTAVTNMNVAVHKGSNGQRQTHWIKVTAWGRTAESIDKNLAKGAHIAAEGELLTEQFQNSRGGTRTITYINARSVQFLNSGRKNGATQGQSSQSQDQAEPVFPVS